MSQDKLRATFIRHGQSRANVGEWCGPFAEIPLTELGQQQAKDLAASWTFTPYRIVVSPYLRTEQTAAPTIARFQDVPVERWAIHEFTFWDRAYWGDSSPEERVEEVARYWRVSDPELRYAAVEGAGQAESFAQMLHRAETALESMKAYPAGERVLLFSHGHFMQALRFVLKFPELSAKEKMERFRWYDDQFKIKNGELVEVEWEGGVWRLREGQG